MSSVRKLRIEIFRAAANAVYVTFAVQVPTSSLPTAGYH